MQNILIIILIVVVLILVWLHFRRKDTKPETGGLNLILQQMNELAKVVDSKMGESRREMQTMVHHQFGESKRLIQEINQEVSKNLIEVAREQTKTNEATRQFMVIADQLSNLEKVLKNQKQRGSLGEASLELVMSNILPPTAYKMQYKFPDGDIVDAAIMTPDGIIPVDAKFPLENYSRLRSETDETRRIEYEEAFKRDLKKRIDETSKYVRPKDNTLPFAFMYIPAESIYYDLLNDGVGVINTRSLIDYAQNDRKVIIVSPTTFAAYLQSVLYGFKAFKIEEATKDIAKNVEKLSRHLKAYEDYYKKLGASISTTARHYDAGYKELGKIDKDILKITGESAGMIPEITDKPMLEE
ncbi:MAG: DNA recombination protein RmuC [Patescibacteria group bacterium]